MRLEDARILFVDDEPMLLEIFSSWLSRDKPHRISTAADGEEALELMAVNSYDLLISDVNMPRMNGIALVRRIAEMGKALPSIIFVSGFGDVDEKEMYGLGVEAFLAKPVTRDQLISMAERAVTGCTDFWRTPMETPPRQSLVIEALDFADNALNGGIALGRGGLSAPYTSPAGLGKVAFECRLSARNFSFAGQGYLRWRCKTEGTIGIEIAYLEESCRTTICEEIGKKNPHAFIPAR